MAEPYPTITVWQPWATLIAEEAKQFEFRGWSSPPALWGRRIAIHAGARPVRRQEVQELLLKLRSPRAAETAVDPAIAVPILEQCLVAPGCLPLSSVLCTATLGRPLRNAALAAALGATFVNDSDRAAHSNWGWPLRDIRRLEPPQPAKGAQGFWNWTPAAEGRAA